MINSVTTLKDENNLFPVFLKLSSLNTLIIGGGNIGLEKLKALLNSSPEACITVVAPQIKDEIKSFSKTHRVELLQREYITADLHGKNLIIAATNNRLLNMRIKIEAWDKNILTNVADTPDLCDFYLSSVVKKGSIKIAISTNGKSPTIAKRLKEIFNSAIPDEMENVLNNLVIIRGRLNGSFSQKVVTLNKLTSVLVQEKSPIQKVLRYTAFAAGAAALILSGHLLIHYSGVDIPSLLENFIGPTFTSGIIQYILVGFIAQYIDGTLGMGYGAAASSLLISTGIPPAYISASVHTSEIFTGAASGIAHFKAGNVNRKLLKALIIPGTAGAVLGAFLLSSLTQYNHLLRPLLSVYTLALGGIILYKAFQNKRNKSKIKRVPLLAFTGGFFDSAGSGGWGPIVTSTLLVKGRPANTTIGTVNLSEFFIALASSAAFVLFIGLSHWILILGLIAGGAAAVPLSVKTSLKIPRQKLMILIGLLIILLSIKNIYFTI